MLVSFVFSILSPLIRIFEHSYYLCIDLASAVKELLITSRTDAITLSIVAQSISNIINQWRKRIKMKKIYDWSMIHKLALSNKNKLGIIWCLIEIRHYCISANYSRRKKCHHFSLIFISFRRELISSQPFQNVRYVLLLFFTNSHLDPVHLRWYCEHYRNQNKSLYRCNR